MSSSGSATKDWVRALEAMQRQHARPDLILAGVVAETALTRPEAPALIGTADTLSYGQLAAQANRYARWALAQGFGRGDCVALLMANQPAYVAIWLGLTQVGCVVALLNTNLAAEGLAHCIRAAAARHVIVGATFSDAAAGADVTWSGTPDVLAFDGAPLRDGEGARPVARDRALMIFTSGTTGLPKAAHVTHARVMAWSGWFSAMADMQPDDRMYDCLPLYHSVGGVVAVGSMLTAGGSVVLREKFSASRFWEDVAATGCTVVQYIGELCRYLLQSPGDAPVHRLRLFCGNGLRGEVWEPFQARFAIPRILEFYAATEGSVSLYNCEGKPGAIGRVPPFLAHRFPVALVRCDPETGEVVRDADGRCVRCGVGEPGEALGPVGDGDGSPLRRFDGYTDDAASSKKLLRDVFALGDLWFRTGDLMRKDAGGYYYFVDRLGDTFRWKGENVATTEVAAVLESCPGVVEAVVFGVAVPGAEGKAGMAALVVAEGFSLTALRAVAVARLPGYARPLFVRICGAIETTGTFKLTKTTLVREGYADSADPVWFDDVVSGGFVGCDDGVKARIAAGEFRR